MERNLYIDASHPNETRVVLKSEENIEDYEYESKKNILVKSNIYLGKVSRVEPSLQATFVDFGRERHGFLAFNDIQPDYYQIPQSDIQNLKQKEEELREKLKEESKKLEESDSPSILDEDFRNSENEFNNVDITNTEELNPANNAVNPIKGDFSCTARSGIRIIENGDIKGPGKSVRIIHNLSTMLKNISEIGNNQKNVIQWASLPSIVPSIKAENIMVNSI